MLCARSAGIRFPQGGIDTPSVPELLGGVLTPVFVVEGSPSEPADGLLTTMFDVSALLSAPVNGALVPVLARDNTGVVAATPEEGV